MHRSLQIAITALAVVLIAKPFECIAAGAPSSQKVADCCLKGKCAPNANSDECCKSTAPDGDQFVTTKAADHIPALAAVIVTDISNVVSPLTIQGLVIEVVHPPPRVSLTAPSLPLLI
jgi:hypothetical protein